MQTIEDEKKELLEWFSKNPDIGRDRTELATARFMKPDQISAENWSALYDVRKKLDVVDMDSFYMVIVWTEFGFLIFMERFNATTI